MQFPSFRAGFTPLIKATLAIQAQHARHTELHGAMAHLLGKGKLFRPLLMLATYYALTGNSPEHYVALATPLELIHTFTLIHDDLPCMDDAQLRRGVPAVHLAYPEALAVLAGDALLNLALYLVATELPETPAEMRVRLMEAYTHATHEVVEGQVLDLEGEGRELSLSELETMHRAKTGALISACCQAGGIIAGQDEEVLSGLANVGTNIGLAFQIRDDLLSVQSSEEAMGKTLSTDEAKSKATYPRLLGITESEKRLDNLLAEIKDDLAAMRLIEPVLLIEIAGLAGMRKH